MSGMTFEQQIGHTRKDPEMLGRRLSDWQWHCVAGVGRLGT